MANMHLSELLDLESMSVIQTGFSKMTAMASVLTDENGTPLTEMSHFSRFCFELTRSTAEGRALCENCDRMGAKQTMRSGKAEVYMELIAHTISQGRQAIVLIPEIALTYQTVMRFYNRFGNKVSIVNSRLSEGEKYDRFMLAREGKIPGVVKSSW